MADVLQRALNPRVAPRRILGGHPHNEPLNLWHHAAPARRAGVRPFPGDQLPVPTQQCVWRRDRGNLLQCRATDAVRASCQPASIRVREPESTLADLTTQEPVLLNQIRNRVTLPALEPAG
jgi:hypothetical protein